MNTSVGRHCIRRSKSVFAIAGAYVLLSFLSDGLVAVPGLGSVRLAVGLAVPFALLVGPLACWGIGAGVVLTDVFRFAVTGETVVIAVAQFLFAYLAYRLWGVVPAVSTGDRPTMDSIRQGAEFLIVTILAAVTAIAFLGWGLEVIGNRPYYLTTLVALPTYVGATLLVGPAVIYGLSGLVHRRPDRYRERNPTRLGLSSFVGAVLIPVVWLVFGTVGSLGFRLAQRVEPSAFAKRDVEFLLYAVRPEMFGHGARRLQIVYGAIMLSLVVATLREANSNECGLLPKLK